MLKSTAARLTTFFQWENLWVIRVLLLELSFSRARQKLMSMMSAIEDILKRGHMQKRVSATMMNRVSTRAHSVFMLSMKCERDDVQMESTRSLVDLGGSERVKRSDVDVGQTFGPFGFVYSDRFREAVLINRDLLSLKKTISALNRKDNYIPFKDSKLTSLLASCLASRFCVIVCATREVEDAIETLESLRFGEQCSSVKNKLESSKIVEKDLIERLDVEIAKLLDTIRAKERWQSKDIERIDIEGKEIVRVTTLVGAEKERDEVELLIKQRARLTGEDASMELAEAGFGARYGGQADALGGNAASRFAEEDTVGLTIKGKKAASWVN